MANDNRTFIPRKFKNIETDKIVDFDKVVNSSQISVILGEPASGKTHQLKEYSKNNKNSFLLKSRHVIKNRSQVKKILLFDSIDEALIFYPNIKDNLIDYIEDNEDKQFVLTCRYLEWKKNFEEELKQINKDLRVYEILPLDDADINKLLKQEDINDFWDFIERNYLRPLLKNIMIVEHLVENFNSKEYHDKQINYTKIYKDIVEEYITAIGEDREEEETDKELDELILFASSLATYMILNRVYFISSTNLKKIAKECYKINEKNLVADDLKAIFKTALFEKKGNDFTFFHKSIQEYLTAYFINLKNLDTNTIKKIFSHNLRFYEEFEEVIIYLTNMQPELFDDFVEFDPFIFRRHPSLNTEQQEKLLLSILDKLQNSEVYAWNRVNFFYSSSLVKFDKVDVYSLIKEKIKDNQNDILLQYIMRLFAENYLEDNQEFEDFIFQKLNQLSTTNKYKCQQYLSYSYNFNYNYNKKLFIFMQENKLFKVANNPNDISSMAYIGDKDNPIAENMFLVLYGCKFNNYNKIEKIEKSDFDFKNLLYLLNYIKLEKFQEFTYWFINLDDIKIWTKYLLYNYENIEKYGYKLDKNISWMFFLIFSKFNLSIKSLEQIIHFIVKHSIFPENTHYLVDNRTELSIKNLHISNISENFWQLYFNNKISIDEVTLFIRNYYTININDIRKIINRHPIENYFIKVFDLIEKLELNNNKNIGMLYFPLNMNQEKIIFQFIKINNIDIQYVAKLLKYHYFKELNNYFFNSLKDLSREENRKLLEISLNDNIKLSENIYFFMKKNKLFGKTKKLKYSDENQSPKLEIELFLSLYGFDYSLCKNNNDFPFIELMFLSKEVCFSDFSLEVTNSIDIVDIEKWFIYILENFEIIRNDDYSFSKNNIMWLINNILLKSKKPPLKKIIFFLKEIQENIPEFSDFFNKNLINAKPIFSLISDLFWSIYFSDKIKNFKEIKNFINLYHISKKDIELAIKKYHIEDYIEKYYALGVQYNFIDIFIKNKQYSRYIEKKLKVKDSLDSSEQNYLDNIQYKINIQNYENRNRFDIFYYAIKQNNNNFKETDKQLKEDLQLNYKTFIDSIIKDYYLLNKEYYDNCSPYNKWIFNYLFNILPTKEAIDNALKSDENYEKLFWYIILGCISTDNRELFKVIEDKFKLFLKVVKEYIEVILEKKNINCFDSSMKWEPNMVYSPCRQIIDIFHNISFDSEQKIWNDFLKYIETKKENEPQYNEFFELIKGINKEPLTIKTTLELIKQNNENSFFYFEYIFKEDMNKALEYFYKYIYDPIPKNIKYSIKKSQIHSLYKSDMNHLFNIYLTDLKYELSPPKNQNEYIPELWIDKRTDEEKKLDEQKRLTEELLEFFKDKNCSYNIVKIIIFAKLLKLFAYKYDLNFEKIDKKYIEKILIDYYEFYREEEIPTAKDYFENQMFVMNKSKSSQTIIRTWGYLQTNINEKKIKLLEKLRKNKNKYISDSANYTLVKIYEKQGKDRGFKNKYYKKIFDKGILPITSSHDLFEVTKEIFDKDIRNWIEEEGTYKSINELSKKKENTNAEDFIQKHILLNITNGFLRRKHKESNFKIIREGQLLDDKRLDIIIFYPPFSSIVIELKLAHNNEVKFKQDDEPTKKTEEYISKLEQYIRGSTSDFGLFVIFNVKDDNTKEKFEEQITNLKELYSKNENISVIGFNCVK